MSFHMLVSCERYIYNPVWGKHVHKVPIHFKPIRAFGRFEKQFLAVDSYILYNSLITVIELFRNSLRQLQIVDSCD